MLWQIIALVQSMFYMIICETSLYKWLSCYEYTLKTPLIFNLKLWKIHQNSNEHEIEHVSWCLVYHLLKSISMEIIGNTWQNCLISIFEYKSGWNGLKYWNTFVQDLFRCTYYNPCLECDMLVSNIMPPALFNKVYVTIPCTQPPIHHTARVIILYSYDLR